MEQKIIEQQLDQFVSEVFENKFEFRPNQKEAIISVILGILNEEEPIKNHIIEAPTGTGKSLINIISAAFLAKYYSKSSYILCSDLYLFSQYEEFIKNNTYLEETIVLLKGQVGNYKCWVNGKDLREGNCRLASASWKDVLVPFKKDFNGNISELEWPCALKCEYCKQRGRLPRAKVVVTTYQNLLYQYTLLPDNKEDWKMLPYNLKPKNIIFCDEAHNIPNIIQEHFTPEFREEDFELHQEIFEFMPNITAVNDGHGAAKPTINGVYSNIKALKVRFGKFWSLLNKKSFKHTELLGIINKFSSEYLIPLNLKAQAIRIALTPPDLAHNKRPKLTPEEWHMLKCTTDFMCFMCKFNDLMDAINKVGAKYVLKQLGDERDECVRLHCLKEDYLCYHYFLSYHKFRVFTTATIGNKKQFDENLGLPWGGKNISRLHRVPSFFDFSNSPIYFLNKYSMSYNKREENIWYIIHYINEIANKHKNERGIIHSGSYKIAKQILENSKIGDRLLFYSNSKEKEEQIKKLKRTPNGILIGPSLTQGVDLPGELCRFIISAKVPYMSLGDDFVVEKMKLFPKWYRSQASIEMVQGIGRGVRFDGDYCSTYILDSGFESLYNITKAQYPPEVQARIRTYYTLNKILDNELKQAV